MPTFKFIFWIFFPIATIYCQSLEEKLNQQLKINGMWGDYYSIDNDSSFHLVKGNVHLDSLYFLSENDINNFFLHKLFKPLLHTKGRNKASNVYEKILNSYSFIDPNTKLIFARHGAKGVAAFIDFKHNFKSSFGGLIGLSRKNDGLILTGQLSANISNFDRSGSSFFLEWAQPDELSRFLKYTLETPFFIRFPIGLKASLRQDFIKDEYLLSSYSFIATKATDLGLMRLGFNNENTNNFLENNYFKKKSLAIGVFFDNTKVNTFQAKGFLIDSDILLGFLKIEGSSILSSSIDFKYVYNLSFGRNFFEYKINWQQSFFDEIEVPYHNKLRFGGATSLRGYREKELIADWFVLNTLEWTNSSFGSVNIPYVFLDYPFSDNIKVGSSYGFGIKNINDNFSFDICLAYSLFMNDVKLHFRVDTQL